MEPFNKKCKLAPKVDVSSAPNSRPSHETCLPQLQQPTPQPQLIHDAAAVERHDFESFARHLQDAAMLIQRQSERPSYKDVSVLLLNWQDDLAVEADLVALEHTFQKHYNFGTQRWKIPTVPNPSIKLGIRLASFLENARPNHLLIIYYVGHGFASHDGQLYWTCSARDDSARLKWDGVRCLFEDARSDILFLLDTCAIPESATRGSHGAKHAIAACTPEQPWRGGAAPSFTASLTEALHKLSSGGRPFGVKRLFEVLSQRWHHPSQNSQPPSPLPVFFTFTPGKSHDLKLAPLASQALSMNGGDTAEGRTVSGREDQLIDPGSVAEVRFDEARILVCTKFVGDANPSMSFFNQWLQNTPPLGTKIAVEGMFLGPPTMLLISMPVSIWNLVQQDKVCCYLGYITSNNMLHLYERLVGPAGVRTSEKEVEDGQILLAARELAASTPARARRETDASDHPHQSSPSADRSLHRDDSELAPQCSPSRSHFASADSSVGSIKPKDEVEDSAEMHEAAEQLKALSHVRHRSDKNLAASQRTRTSLPDAVPVVGRDAMSAAHSAALQSTDGSTMNADTQSALNSRAKAGRRFIPRKKTRCSHCSHLPSKNATSLRKHVAAAHTRPFPCAFSFASCVSTFGSKNEWKRHIASQHLCLQYYRCSQCPPSAAEGKGNEFNRKDLFTQHLRRMHSPFQVKRAMSKGESKLLAEWEEHVKSMQQTCLVTRRQPPQRLACPKAGCQREFNGAGSWDEWTEHVGRHIEKGEAQGLGVDGLLAQWALDEGIIETKGDGEYRLCSANGVVGGPGGNSSLVLDSKDAPALLTQANAYQPEDTPMVDPRPSEDGQGER